MGATDSKLAFRKGVFRLFEERHIPENDEYWTQFWLLPESADDVYSLIGASDIRRVRDQARENLETMLTKVINRLLLLMKTPDFPNAGNTARQLLNCVRILTRIMPFVYETDDCADWEGQYFWTPKSLPKLDTSEQDPDTKSVPEFDVVQPLAQTLLKACIDLLFLVGFTVPTNIAAGESRVMYVIWETGVGCSTPIGTSKEYDSNRTEVLRLLLVLCSKSVYTPPGLVLSSENRWLHYLTTETERKTVLAMLCSLLNTATKYNPLGWGVPYNHVMFTDPREVLVTLCIQVLLVLVEYQVPAHRHLMEQSTEEGGSSQANNWSPGTGSSAKEDGPLADTVASHSLAPSASAPTATSSRASSFGSNDALPNGPRAKESNAFRHYLTKLHRPADFQFLMDGIYRILSNPMQATNTYLPGSTKQIRCYVEMMMLCWKLLDLNKRFRSYLLETDRVLDLIIVLIYYSLEFKLNPANVGLVRMCAFMLQTMSADRSFGVKLNRTFDAHSSLPAAIRIPNFHGTYTDYLIISLYTLIATTRGALSTLYPALLLIISNISPYIKNLSVTSCNKLISLFSAFSSPQFLLADETNHELVGYLLETFDYIIQYQYASNAQLTYAIVRSHKTFEGLRDFNLESAQAEAEKAKAAREQRRRRSAPPETDLRCNSQAASAADGTVLEGADRGDVDHSLPTATLTEEADGEQVPSGALSDKAKGKRPELADGESSESVARPASIASRDSNQSISTNIARSTVQAENFVATEDWVATWHERLPLQAIMTLLDHLVPQIEDKCASQQLTTDHQVLDFIRTITLVGILPAPHPIYIRQFQWGEALLIWFRSMIWGQAYVASIASHGVWNGTGIRLFQIKQGKSGTP